ncbi:hypothetical protein HMPREF9719_01007, partial [Corynebacterium otitidis ATCC 51513]
MRRARRGNPEATPAGTPRRGGGALR